jgi:hypothetical protein
MGSGTRRRWETEVCVQVLQVALEAGRQGGGRWSRQTWRRARAVYESTRVEQTRQTLQTSRPDSLCSTLLETAWRKRRAGRCSGSCCHVTVGLRRCVDWTPLKGPRLEAL